MLKQRFKLWLALHVLKGVGGPHMDDKLVMVSSFNEIVRLHKGGKRKLCPACNMAHPCPTYRTAYRGAVRL